MRSSLQTSVLKSCFSVNFVAQVTMKNNNIRLIFKNLKLSPFSIRNPAIQNNPSKLGTVRNIFHLMTIPDTQSIRYICTSASLRARVMKKQDLCQSDKLSNVASEAHFFSEGLFAEVKHLRRLFFSYYFLPWSFKCQRARF